MNAQTGKQVASIPERLQWENLLYDLCAMPIDQTTEQRAKLAERMAQLEEDVADLKVTIKRFTS